MPVLAKFCGIVIRLMIGSTIGTRLHAFYGDSELVLALHPLRVIQGDVPPWVQQNVLAWATAHQHEFVAPWGAPEQALPVQQPGRARSL